MNIEQIAKIAHETNRSYCQSIGDDTQPTWELAPDWQKQSAIKGVEFHIGSHANGITPSPSASHESWLAEKEIAGWKYGTIKDPVKKEHPCFLPYDDLPLEQKMKDYLFGAIVATFYKVEEANS